MTERNAARVLDVGQCDPDHVAVRRLVGQNFSADVDRAASIDEALEQMRKQQYDLVLVNRIIFNDGCEGMDLIRRARREALTAPIMMVSNYPDAQSEAVAAGAVPGFGKAGLDADTTYELLARFLPTKQVRST